MSAVNMIFWDVQHGNATYIQTPNNKRVVIDLGVGDYSGQNESFSPLVKLWNMGIRKLNHVVITHPHLDHIDDIDNFYLLLPSLLTTPRHIPDEHIRSNVRESDKSKFDKYCEIRSHYSNDVTDNVDNPAIASNYGGVEFLRFSSPHLPLSNLNNHSILTVLKYNGFTVVLPGDNEYASLDYMMQSEHFKNTVEDADILLAPHHGRESAYHKEFVELVNPRVTIVSDGSLCDTSANHRYSAKSRGWTVHNDTRRTSETRKCLTTNCDGEVYVSFGSNGDGRYLRVSVL